MRRLSEMWLGLFLTVVAGACVLHAQGTLVPPAHREALESWPAIGFDVTVLDGQHIPITSLTSERMDVREDGKSVAKFDLAPSGNEPQSVCILVDTSGSTFKDRDVIRRSLLKLISDLSPKDEVCLVDFSVPAYVDVNFTMDPASLRRATQYLKISGGSAVIDAIEATTQYMMKEAQFRSRAIILLSDGSDNASKKTESQLFKVLHAPGGPAVYAVDNQAPGRWESRDREGRNLVVRLAKETGGQALFANGDAEVDATVTNLVQTLDHRYRLILTTAGTQDGSAHRLGVTLNKDLRKEKMVVNATRGFDALLP
jgi:Ca-activated chloride channel family protein